MRLPEINNASVGKSVLVTKFGGINRRARNGEFSIYDTENMTCEDYPCVKTRKKRVRLASISGGKAPHGMIYAGGTVYCAGTSFFYHGTEYENAVTDTDKSMIVMNGKIYIFPDKKYFDPTFSRMYDIEIVNTYAAGDISFHDGTLYSSPAAGNALTVVTPSFPMNLTVGDAVEISGCQTHTANNKTCILTGVSGDHKTLYFSENCFENGTEQVPVTVARRIPDMDYVIECENRVLGCSGSDIFISHLGRPECFNDYSTPGTGAYTVRAAGGGDFTGFCEYGGYPYFFKEDRVYKLYGSVPEDYELVDVAGNGVAEGSGGSLSVCAGALYYLSPTGVCRFTGGNPEIISECLCETLSCGRSGTDGKRYYLSCLNSADEPVLIVYDTALGAWMREDNVRAHCFTHYGGLYMQTADGIYELTGRETDGVPEDDIHYCLESGEYTAGDATEGKYPSGITLFCSLPPSRSASLYISYDGEEFLYVGEISSRAPYVTRIPLVLRRCNVFRVKISGTGDFSLNAVKLGFIDKK